MSSTIAETQYGKVQGTKSGPVLVWKGIPFAQPPIGNLRFRAPQAPSSWTGVREATTFGLASAQSGPMMQRLFSSTPEPSGEDCLYLNIWSPGANEKRRPVLFWIHGGAFTMGSSSIPWYDGTAFGGDPGNITVFGESAGAMSIGSLLAMREAKGLFQKAILQSGASDTVLEKERATRITHKLMDILGFHEITDLVNVPLEQLPIQAITSGSANGASHLVGTNRDEMRLFTMMDPAQATQDMAILERLFGTKAREVVATYEAAHPEQSSADAWIDFLTDRTFRIPAIRLAECQSAQGTNVWMYRFDWPTPVFGGSLKACHGLEIAFVWNNLDKYGANILTGDDPARQKVADAMHPAWISFAHSGNPTTSGLPSWPAYDTTHRATMLFNEECKVENDLRGAELQLWEGVL